MSSTFFDLTPNKANLTLNTNIPGIQLNLDEQPKDTPYTVEGVVGVQRQLSAPSTVTVGGKSYEFTGWSDGGAAVACDFDTVVEHDLHGELQPVAVTYLSDLPFVGTPTNGWGPVERDRSNGEQGAADGAPLKIRGTTYAKGLGVHSTSQSRVQSGGCVHDVFGRPGHRRRNQWRRQRCISGARRRRFDFHQQHDPRHVADLAAHAQRDRRQYN